MAWPISALLNWTPGARREPGLRAQHARRLRRPRLHHHQHRPQRGRHHAGLRPQRPQLRPRQLRPRARSRTDITELDRASAIRSADRAAEQQRQSGARPRHLRRGRARAAPTASPATAAASGRPAASPTIRPTSTRCRARIPASSTSAVDLGLGLPNGFNSAAGAGRALRSPAAARRSRSGSASSRQVGTFTATNPIEAAPRRHQPDQHRGAGAGRRRRVRRRRVQHADAARHLRQRAVLPPRRSARRSRRRSASAPIRTSCRRCRRTGAPAPAAWRTSSTAIRPRSPT